MDSDEHKQNSTGQRKQMLNYYFHLTLVCKVLVIGSVDDISIVFLIKQFGKLLLDCRGNCLPESQCKHYGNINFPDKDFKTYLVNPEYHFTTVYKWSVRCSNTFPFGKSIQLFPYHDEPRPLAWWYSSSSWTKLLFPEKCIAKLLLLQPHCFPNRN